MDNNLREYEIIDELVFAYQDGSVEAAEQLLRYFGYDSETKELSKYLNKYYSLLRFGVINFGDKDTRKFLRQYTSDETLKKALLPYYQYAATKKATRKIVQMINFRLRHLTDEELVQDLVLVLLNQAMKYRKTKPQVNFCGYLFNSYRHSLHDHLKYLFRDLLYSHEMDMLEDHRDENSEFVIEDILKKDRYFEKEKEALGFNWILGGTANFPFNQLNVFERTLVHLYDYKNLTYEQVGELMGYHRDTIWKKRKELKSKLTRLVKEGQPD